MPKPTPAATAIVVAPDSTGGLQLVCVHRAPGLRFLGGFAAFPGGGRDEGESLAEACVRETFEEVGLLLVPGGAAGLRREAARERAGGRAGQRGVQRDRRGRRARRERLRGRGVLRGRRRGRQQRLLQQLLPGRARRGVAAPAQRAAQHRGLPPGRENVIVMILS